MLNGKKFVLLHPLSKKIQRCFLGQQESLEMVKSDAEIAQLVEHDLAKVGVASSSLVFRSKVYESQKPTADGQWLKALVVEW